jgi:hypothetical protein
MNAELRLSYFSFWLTFTGEIGHHTSTFLSDTKMDISRPQGITNSIQPPIIKAHGNVTVVLLSRLCMHNLKRYCNVLIITTDTSVLMTGYPVALQVP